MTEKIQAPDLDRLEALVREYGNTPLLGAGRTRKVVMADIHSMFSRCAQPEGMSTALREVTDKLAATAAENLSLNMANIDLRDQLARVTGIRPEGEAPQAEQAWEKLTDATFMDFGRLVDVLLSNGVYEYGRQVNQVDWTQVREWRYAAPAAEHAESGAPAPADERVDAIVTALYRRFKDWSKRGFSADDVTWCEVKADVIALIATGAAESGAQAGELPPLPQGVELGWSTRNVRIMGYTYSMMQDYARQALAAQSQGAQAARIDVKHEFERWASQRGESAVYIGDGLYRSRTVTEMAEAFAAGVEVARAALAAKAGAPTHCDPAEGFCAACREQERAQQAAAPGARQAELVQLLSEGVNMVAALADAHKAHDANTVRWLGAAGTLVETMRSAPGTPEAPAGELERLRALLNTPELHDFSKGVVLEATHQRERWSTDNDAGKQPADWFWLLGYLGGKALRAHIDGDTEKALHHTISTAAACANWHAAVLGKTSMRPGIEPPAEIAAQLDGGQGEGE